MTKCLQKLCQSIMAQADLDLFHLVAATGDWVSFGPADWVHSMWSCSEPGGHKRDLYHC